MDSSRDEATRPGSTRVARAARARSGLAALAALWIGGGLAASAHAQVATIDVLLDLDRDRASGCAVGTPDGDAEGIERRLRVQVDVSTREVSDVSIADCLATGTDTFGPGTTPSTIPSPPWPVAVGEGRSGSTLIEAPLPLSVLAGAPAIDVALRVSSAAGNDALRTPGGGEGTEPLTLFLAPAGVPGLSPELAALLALALVLLALRSPPGDRSRARLLGLLLPGLLVLLVSAPRVQAALGDGIFRIWSESETLSADPEGDAPIGADLLGIWSSVDPTAGLLWLRFDVLLEPPVCLPWELVDPGSDFPCLQEPPPDQGPFGLAVAMTFDDGPNPATTPSVLATLRGEGIPATFFVVGRKLQTTAERALALEIDQDPLFRIANHSVDHPRFTTISAEEAEYQVDTTSDRIREAIGDPCYFPRHFRFPFGASDCQSMEIVRARGLSTAGVHIDSKDWCYASGDGFCDTAGVPWMPEQYRDDMVGFVVSRLRASGGGIMLMHDVHANTAASLPAVISALRAEGASFVSLEDPVLFPLLNGEVEPPPPPACCNGTLR